MHSRQEVKRGRSEVGSFVPFRRTSSSISSFGPVLSVFSGGTAFNCVTKEINFLLSNRVNHILPISDNGGSSREIVRMLGGPAIGDIRSRLIRLASEKTREQRAIKTLLNYRLSTSDRKIAKEEMLSIVDGTHPIWLSEMEIDEEERQEERDPDDPIISEAYKQTVRAFLCTFFDSVMRCSSVHEREWDVISLSSSESPTLEFDFRGGSIGNFVFTGARLFFRSLEAAIFWFSNLSAVPIESTVIPVLSLNTRVTIGARLEDGSVITGQDEISHPHTSSSEAHQAFEPLSSRIDRIFYVNQFGGEITLPVNRTVLKALKKSEGIIYGMGSLYTSIIPSLILDGVGRVIRESKFPKLLLLNASNDRETYGMNAVDFVIAIAKALMRNDVEAAQDSLRSSGHMDDIMYLRSAGVHYISHILFAECSAVTSTMVTEDSMRVLSDAGIILVPVQAKLNSSDFKVTCDEETSTVKKNYLSFVFDETDLTRAIESVIKCTRIE